MVIKTHYALFQNTCIMVLLVIYL